MAHTQSLREAKTLPGQACLHKAGRSQQEFPTGENTEPNYRQILRSLMARNAEVDPLSLAARYSNAERLQLAETALHCLDDEIRSLRKASIAFRQLAETSREEAEVKAAGNVLEMYGRSCIRIANLIKINVGLKGGDADELASQLLRALDAVTFTQNSENEVADGSH
jgi:hypothetical protein